MNALAAIHVAKKQLGLDDETYRAVLVRVTGKASSKEMSEAERGRVLEEFRRLGFSNPPLSPKAATSPPQGGRQTSPRRRLEGKYAGKLQSLWIAAWNLGIARSRHDKALIAFVRRQTGIDHVRFVRDQDDAAKAIEALKGWLAREAGVDWANPRYWPAHTKLSGFKIACAQFAILKREDPKFGECDSLAHWMEQTSKERPGCPRHPLGMTDKTWPAVMNALGERVRAMKGAV